MRRNRVPIKNHTEETNLINSRCLMTFFFISLLTLLLILRLAWLQLIHTSVFTTLSKKNWLDLVPREPTRGLIFDRHGTLLAENIPVFSLDITPNKTKNIKKTLSKLQEIITLTSDDLSQFHHELKQHRRFDEVMLKLRLTEKEAAIFSENQYRFPSVQIKGRLIRHYPQGKTFSHILGYVGRINLKELQIIDPVNYSATTYIGKLGIEKKHENDLHGKVGYEQAENDARGQSIRILKQTAPTPGKNLWLTIDANLQKAAEKAFSGSRGALVAIDPQNGEVLALLSQPSYDPNIFVTGISNHQYKELLTSTDRPLYNRAIRGTYSPGSTIKPYVALEALDSEIITPQTSLYDPGWFQLEERGHIFHDWRRRGHGFVNVDRAITVSCDTFFYKLAKEIGIEPIDEMLEAFGFGRPTQIDMTGETSGVIASPKWKHKFRHQPWYTGDTIISTIGQGFMQFTPIQMASATATLSTRGKRFQPHLVSAYEIDNKKTTVAPHELPNVEIEENDWWDTIINAMENVIRSNEGTGYHFGHPKYPVAAKTGTAQRHSIHHRDPEQEHEDQGSLPERLRDNSLFIGFAPVQTPRIAIAVVVENENSASRIARKVMDAFMAEQESN